MVEESKEVIMTLPSDVDALLVCHINVVALQPSFEGNEEYMLLAVTPMMS